MNLTPPRIRDVVVATDGSRDADAAVDWACEEAMRRSAWLLILSAYAPDADGPDGRRSAQDIVDIAADHARRRFPGLLVETRVVEGDARQALLSAQDDAALIVLGSGGRTALRAVWLGSVSYWATRHLRVPTVVVRPLPGPQRMSGVCVGVDTPASEPTLRAAFEMAAHRRCPLTIGHAWWDVFDAATPWLAVTSAEVDAGHRGMVADLLAKTAEDFPDVDYTVQFARGNVIAYLTDLARAHEALFIGRRRTAPFDDAGLGTVATAVVEHARGVVVVVPAAPLPRSEGGEPNGSREAQGHPRLDSRVGAHDRPQLANASAPHRVEHPVTW